VTGLIGGPARDPPLGAVPCSISVIANAAQNA
jgi:hypothetical protein